MNNKRNIWIPLVILATILSVSLVACNPVEPATQSEQSIAVEIQEGSESLVLSTPVNDITEVDDQGISSINPDSLESTILGTDALDQDEIAGLLFMREEEKLAHDVYIAMYEEWGLPIFENIAGSEQTHMDAVLTLLNTYNLADPASERGPGEFMNPDLQALYDQLVAQGNLSMSDALKVGAAIEEIDILDLESRLAQTDNPDIRLVYENLMKGSRNHLRSFTSTLARQTGEVYQPQYLSNEVYQSIISSAIESGGNGNQP